MIADQFICAECDRSEGSVGNHWGCAMNTWKNGKTLRKYTDEKGNPISPFSKNVGHAVRFARDRKEKIMDYRLSIEAR